MKITLIQTGKTRFEYLQDGISDYRERLKHYIKIEELTIPDLKDRKKLTVEEIKTREGDHILKKIKSVDFVILLDEKGKSFTSVELADYLQKRMLSGRNIVIVIGGAYGFSRLVYQRADETISFSRLTFSHQLVRLILVEQLYRAMTIIRGEPYHHE